ncbi:MAG TPA: hypothetical protein VGK46_04660 [Saprospiraceae bacterium]
MKPRISFFACLLIVSSSFAQETELDRRNGFKDIKLASSIDSIKGAIFKKDFKDKGHHPAKLYEIDHPDYKSIGEVAINHIEVKTYKGFIYEILVITDKDERLMKGMERALGKPIYNVRDESYNWAGKQVGLRFSSHSRSQLQLLYTSTIIINKMKEDKSKKIDDISGDF